MTPLLFLQIGTIISFFGVLLAIYYYGFRKKLTKKYIPFSHRVESLESVFQRINIVNSSNIVEYLFQASDNHSRIVREKYSEKINIEDLSRLLDCQNQHLKKGYTIAINFLVDSLLRYFSSTERKAPRISIKVNAFDNDEYELKTKFITERWEKLRSEKILESAIHKVCKNEGSMFSSNNLYQEVTAGLLGAKVDIKEAAVEVSSTRYRSIVALPLSYRRSGIGQDLVRQIQSDENFDEVLGFLFVDSKEADYFDHVDFWVVQQISIAMTQYFLSRALYTYLSSDYKDAVEQVNSLSSKVDNLISFSKYKSDWTIKSDYNFANQKT